jgi:hypothetical protein
MLFPHFLKYTNNQSDSQARRANLQSCNWVQIIARVWRTIHTKKIKSRGSKLAATKRAATLYFPNDLNAR